MLAFNLILEERKTIHKPISMLPSPLKPPLKLLIGKTKTKLACHFAHTAATHTKMINEFK